MSKAAYSDERIASESDVVHLALGKYKLQYPELQAIAIKMKPEERPQTYSEWDKLFKRAADEKQVAINEAAKLEKANAG